MGVGIGGFAQGLASGLGQGVQMGSVIDRDKREKEKFALEKPRLEAEAEKSKADLAFQKDFQENMANLMAESKGGVVELEDGTTQERPGMDPLDVQLRAAEIMKEAMFRHGKLDFAQLKAARDYGKELQSEGVLEAMRYAMANPQDQAGIREMFNKKGKMKLGDDIQIGVENGDFGPTVVGYKVGADGKQVKAFDGAELLMPYLGAQTFAQMAQQNRIAQGKEKGDDRRAGIAAGATVESARIRERGAIAGLRFQQDREDSRASRALDTDAQKAVMDIANTNITMIGRNSNPGDANYVANVQRQAAGFAADMVANPQSPFYRKPQQAFDAAFKRVAQEYNINLNDPMFAPLNAAKPKK